MSTDKIIVYQTFDDPVKANIVKGLFDANDISCFLSDENIVAINPLYSNAVGGVKLNVFERDLDRITAILKAEHVYAEPDSPVEEETGSTICPNCHSTNVSYGGSVKRKFGYFSIFVSLLLMIYPFSMRKTFRCFDCDHEFK